MTAAAHCSHCGEPLVIVLEMDDKPVIDRLDRIERSLRGIRNNEEKIMSDQTQLDADVAAVEAVTADENTAIQNIQAEIDALKSANPGLDLSGLETAIGGLQGAQSGVDALETPATPVVDGDSTTAPAAE